MLHRITCLLSTLFLMPLLTAHGAADIAPVSVSFPVRTHGIPLTRTELRKVLNIAQTKLAHNKGFNILLDPGEDSFKGDNVKDEGPIVFEAGDVDGCDAVAKLLNEEPGVVHIVRDIPCCGVDKEGEGKPQIVGCSGLNLAILVLPPDQEEDLQSRAVQWMHELGHNRGLCHSRCNASDLMSPNPIGGTDTHLDSCEKRVLTGAGSLSDLECTQTQSCRQMKCDDTQSMLKRQ